MKTISDSYVKLLKEVTQLRYAGKFTSALQLIESYLSKTKMMPEEQIRCAILKGSILNTMGVYKGSKIIFDELIEEINAFNLPEEYLEANLLKIDALNKLSLREDCITLINDMEDYLTTQKEILPEKRKKIKAALLYHKGDHFWRKGTLDVSLDYLNQSKDNLKGIDDQELLGIVYNRIGAVYYYKGMFEKSFRYYKMNFDIQLSLMNKRELSTAYNNMADIYLYRGEYDIALECFENSYVIDEELGNKTDQGISLLNIGITHLFLGNHKKALTSLKESLALNEEAHNENPASSSLHFLIQLLLAIQAPKTEVNYYLTKLEQLYQTSKNKVIHDRYLVSKGLVLKSSNRLSEKVEAQTYFKKVVEDSSSLFEISNIAFLNLIELLLLELKSTESPEVLTEIEDLTKKLLNTAKKQNLAPILVKTYILQSKLKLLQLEINKAKELLDKAGELAEKKNLRKLSLAVMKEHKILFDKLNSWENLAEKKISLRERVELAQIEDTLFKMTSHKLEHVDDIEILAKEFTIDKLGLVVFRFGMAGAEFFKGINLPKSDHLDRDLIFMSSTFMTVMGQGNKYHTGLFGPLPASIEGYAAITYSLTMNDKDQGDDRLKGKTYSLFVILYPQDFSTMFFKRNAIEKIFKNKINELNDLTDLTEGFLLELREDIFQKVTEVFTYTSTLGNKETTTHNIKSM